MKVMFVSSEVVPFAKTGGLADVAGSLPKALQAEGHEVRVFLPRYRQVDVKKFGLKKVQNGDLEVRLGDRAERAAVYEAKLPGGQVSVYFIDHPGFFGDRPELYMAEGKDYPDNLARFAFFCRAVLQFVQQSGWQPEIVHCNDWQSALIAAYLRVPPADPFFARAAVVYSVHNLGYLGLFPKEQFPQTGLGWEQFTPDKLEFWGQLALAKAGFVYADIINTVSHTYAQEIQTPEYGHGLDGLLRSRHQDVFGIVNGLDYEIWDPATDPKIAKKYSPATIGFKDENKQALQTANNLPRKKGTPVIGLISRLADQKGLDILAAALEKIMALPCQLVVLGTGDPKYHELLKQARQARPEQIGLNLGFDAALAQLIYAGSDLFLMPSRYEPCGLGQLISFKYGVLPIVRRTGGLADTVHDVDPKSGSGDGFVFSDYSADALYDAVRRAVETFKKKALWKKLVQRVMAYDYSWASSARHYTELYRQAAAKRA